MATQAKLEASARTFIHTSYRCPFIYRTVPILQWKTTVSRVLGVEGYSTYFYILAFFKAKWLTAHGTRQLQIFQVAYARFPDKA